MGKGQPPSVGLKKCVVGVQKILFKRINIMANKEKRKKEKKKPAKLTPAEKKKKKKEKKKSK